MRLLGLDPSSKICGYGCVDAAAGEIERMVEAGVLTPHKVSAPAHERGRSLAIQAIELIDEFAPVHQLVIEIPAPQGPRAGRAGQANYGLAVGLLVGVLQCRVTGIPIELVRADRWTRQVRKIHRAGEIAQRFPEYDPKQDPGMDAADGLELCAWWIRERESKGAIG